MEKAYHNTMLKKLAASRSISTQPQNTAETDTFALPPSPKDMPSTGDKSTVILADSLSSNQRLMEQNLNH